MTTAHSRFTRHAFLALAVASIVGVAGCGQDSAPKQAGRDLDAPPVRRLHAAVEANG